MKTAPSRRAMLSGSAALLTGVTAALAAQPSWEFPILPAEKSANPDAELIRLCDRNAILEKKLEKEYPANLDIPDDCPIMAEMNRAMERIWTMQATTLEGFQARAKATVLYAPEFLRIDETTDYAKRMVSALLRDLIG
jgi:hypothetical protein